jgi:hypothetical protein
VTDVILLSLTTVKLEYNVEYSLEYNQEINCVKKKCVSRIARYCLKR